MNGSWKTVATPTPALRTLLTNLEPLSTVMTEKLLRTSLDRRLRTGGRFYVRSPRAAVYHGPGGFFYPVGLVASKLEAGDLPALRRQIGPFVRPHSIMGQTEDVNLLATAFGDARRHDVDYHLLILEREHFPRANRAPDPRLRVVCPSRRDAGRILPLQVAYEVEEVLLPGRSPNLGVSRASVNESLATQRVLIAESAGAVIARVATNARGVSWDQVGGVYTDPAWRGRGVARWLMTHLLARLAGDGKHASLFVKTANAAAQGLYGSLGFRFESHFRISYYIDT